MADWELEEPVYDRLSERLLELDAVLLSDAVDEEAMLLSELDGFLVGVIVCPEPIPPSEWLPLIWGVEAPVFESQAQAQRVLDLVMWHYNDLIAQLDRGRYEPIYNLDRDGSPVWEIWIEGFWQAMCLRPDVWTAWSEKEDADLQVALSVFARLVELALQPEDLERGDGDEELEALASELIASQAETLHRARLAGEGASAKSAGRAFGNVGRNDPCPCGSGKKFKKCCLN